MRDYAKVSPEFWTGTTGKKIRSLGPEAQVLALYLITNPHANMLGLYYLPVVLMCHETGLSDEGATEGLQSLSEAGFCCFDAPSEYVWVPEMARFQVGDELKPSDNRVAGIKKAYASLPKNPFLRDFFDRYHRAFHLDEPRGSQAPYQPLRSQEQEQEQEKEQEQKSKTAPSPKVDDAAGEAPPDDFPEEPSRVILSLPLNTGPDHLVTQAEADEWAELYPAVDVIVELRKMRGWCKSNTTRRKTKTGINRFITNWLAKAQDTAPRDRRVPKIEDDWEALAR